MNTPVTSRCHAIEECYEFMLAYAAQGVSGDAGQANVGQLRTLMTQAEQALDGLPDAMRTAVAEAQLGPRDTYEAFLVVLDRDAQASLAAVRLVLAQPAISSQLVDNLNASIHLRALLTDIFLIDEILTTRTGVHAGPVPAQGSS